MKTPAQVLSAAIAANVLPADATLSAADSRPWPVIVLTALGAWLAAIPLFLVVALLFEGMLNHATGQYVIGVLGIALGTVLLRSRDLPLFMEQLAIPVLLAGVCCLSLGLFHDLSDQGALLILAATGVALVAAIPRAWLHNLLGCAIAGCLIGALVPANHPHAPATDLWLGTHAVFVLWLLGLWIQHAWPSTSARAAVAATIESTATGGLIAMLVVLALTSGQTFLAGGQFLRDMTGDWRHALPPVPLFMPVTSGILALLAAGFALRSWPGLRKPLPLALAASLILLAVFMNCLGAVLLALSVTACTRRFLPACAAALTAAWVIGSFYYQLAWPFTTKALVMTGTGAAMGLSVWLSARTGIRRDASRTQHVRFDTRAAGLLALTAIATLAVVNVAIWQKEDLIARGTPIFVPLMPVDPRSLMQGDYMALRFPLPDEAAPPEFSRLASGKRLHVAARKDERGITQILRYVAPGTTLAPGEFGIELTPHAGTWMLVSDAWFFREGDGQRWAQGRYGEFRVADDGEALLVGVADANLRRITP